MTELPKRPGGLPDPAALADCSAAGIDCAQVLAQVWSYLDGEMDDTARSGLRTHLEECGPCLRAYGLEREVKVLVARCCGSDRAPEQLRIRVLASIRTEISLVETSVLHGD